MTDVPKGSTAWRRISTKELAQELVPLLGRGMTNQEIGDQLYLALDTVKDRCRALYRALGAKDRTHAVTLSLALGLVSVDQIVDVGRVIPSPVADAVRSDKWTPQRPVPGDVA